MELSGLVLAAIIAAIILYVVPVRVARRHAVANSREGDRFSSQLELVPVAPSSSGVKATRNADAVGGTHYLPTPSSVPLLATNQGTVSQGAKMPDAPRVGSATDTELEVEKPMSLHPTREYAALRASRVARRAREQAAAKRRVVMVGVAVVLILIFTGFAAAGWMSWAWLTIPSVALVGSVAGSVLAAGKTRNLDQEEAKRLAELKVALRSMRSRQRPSDVFVQFEPLTVRKSVKKQKAASEEAPEQGLGGDVRPAAEVPAVKASQVRPQEGAAAAPEMAKERVPSETKDGEAVGQVELFEEEAERQPLFPGLDAEPQGSLEGEVSSIASEEAEGERGWTVVPLPAPMHSLKQSVTNRQVHPDTDLLEVPSSSKKASVPARPTRKSSGFAPSPSGKAAKPEATGPTFQFDLDSVLDQRRAQ